MASQPTNHAWLALTPEEALEPDLPICDPHHHLWDFHASDVAPRYLLDEILEDLNSGHNIVSTVFIECGAMFKTDGLDAMRPIGETEMASQPTNHAWLALTPEEALEPDLPICDPHHHLWDFHASDVAPRYLLDEILEDLNSGHNIVSTVFIECGAMFKTDGLDAMRPIGETEFVNGIAAMSASGIYGSARVAAGIVGTANLRLGDAVAEVLDAQIEAGGRRFRGIRLGATWDASDDVPNHRTGPPEGLLLRSDFRKGFAHLAPRDLTFEVWCYHRQIPEATDLARAFPDTTLILDHFGGPIGIGPYAGSADEVFAQWRTRVDALADCPNVVAKLGGINMVVNGFGWHHNSRPPTSQELLDATRHYYDYTIEKFGVDRCMFESNFPVDKQSCSYTVLWNAFKRLTAGFSADEKAKLFHDTAARVYRLDPPT